MPKKTPKNQIIKDLQRALDGKVEILEDMIIDNNYIEIPLELADTPDYNTIENILKRYGFEISHITKYTIVYTKPRTKLAWEIQEFLEQIGLLGDH